MDTATCVARLRDARAHRIVIVAPGREPEELANNPGRWKALAKRLGAGDVTEVQGYDKTGVLVSRLSPRDTASASVAIPSAAPPSPAATGRSPVQESAPRNTVAAGGSLDPEAQRFRAFVEGQQVILSQFQAMLDPIFRGFSNVTESLAMRVAQLEAQAAAEPHYIEHDEPEPPRSQVDDLAGEVLKGVASTMGIPTGVQK